MAKGALFHRFRDISIAKKLYFAVGLMAFLIAIELFTLWFAITTLSSVRAFVGGEGLWSKGQKDAVYHLQKYGHSHNEEDYQNFLSFMRVPLGDHKTRMELSKPNPDLDVARQGFIEGRNHPDDVDGMIKLVMRFHSISYINKALTIWAQADSVVAPLIPLGADLHAEITSPVTSQTRVDSLLRRIESINEGVTTLEDEFSFTLGEGSRWLENLILKLLFAVALTVEITGLLLTISVSRDIQKGLNEIIRASKRIAAGDFKARAKAFSGDEIGILANSLNKMSEELDKSNNSLKNYARRLEQSNENLEQFAYIASHDLQEPLRTITNFVSLLEEKEKNKMDENSYRYLQRIVVAANRMKSLIRDVLYFSKIGKHHATDLVDCNQAMQHTLTDLRPEIEKNHAKITVDHLPPVRSSAIEIQHLFLNLVSNALKYRKKDVTPEVHISAVPHDEWYWKFSVKDNGIGIEKPYTDKIFVIFQRLHNHHEYSGTGIGLAACKKIIELNGGTIWVESEPEQGSTFYFTIPKA